MRTNQTNNGLDAATNSLYLNYLFYDEWGNWFPITLIVFIDRGENRAWLKVEKLSTWGELIATAHVLPLPLFLFFLLWSLSMYIYFW